MKDTWKLALALTMAVGVVAISGQVAHGGPQAEAGGPPADAISWDGSELRWAADISAATEPTLLGTSLHKPGDAVTQTLTIVNDGDRGGWARVEIRNVTTVVPDPDCDGDLDDVIRLNWQIGDHTGDQLWKELRESEDEDAVAYAVSVPVRMGQFFPVTLGVYYPEDAPDGSSLGRTASVLHLDVTVTLEDRELIVVATGGGVGAHVSPDPTWAVAALVALGMTGLAAARIAWRRPL